MKAAHLRFFAGIFSFLLRSPGGSCQERETNNASQPELPRAWRSSSASPAFLLRTTRDGGKSLEARWPLSRWTNRGSLQKPKKLPTSHLEFPQLAGRERLSGACGCPMAAHLSQRDVSQAKDASATRSPKDSIVPSLNQHPGTRGCLQNVSPCSVFGAIWARRRYPRPIWCRTKTDSRLKSL